MPATSYTDGCCHKTVMAHCEGCPYIPVKDCGCTRCNSFRIKNWVDNSIIDAEAAEAMRPVMSDYHVALHKCGERYRDMLRPYPPIPAHLWKFNLDFMKGCLDCMPVPKLCRWLGYIQGMLIAHGYTTVEEERNWTRPLFRLLDYPEES